MEQLEKGVVIKTTGSWHIVADSQKNKISCKIKGKLRQTGIRSTNPIAVGDVVDFYRLINEETGVITNIRERKNYIIRRSSKLSKESHILAANVDQAFLMISMNSPRVTLRFVDRFLVTCEAYSVPAVILFNKTDIYSQNEKDEMEALIRLYSSAGYDSIRTSALKKEGIDELKNRTENRITLIAGNSGVGKSTLINTMDPSLNLKTSPLSYYYETGKHTTTFTEMFELLWGGYIIDSPGIKGFGLIRMDREELFHFFPEIFSASKNCQYYNCLHISEPGCAVKQAVESGEIGLSRYESYLSLYHEDRGKYRVTKY